MTTGPVWIERRVVDTLHDLLLLEYGGSPGIRDSGLVDSALDRPRSEAAHADADVSTLAAACAYGLAQSRGYVDGNKRVAATTMGVFLDLNGFELVVPEAELVATILALAAGQLGEGDLAEWIRGNLRPRPPATPSPPQ